MEINNISELTEYAKRFTCVEELINDYLIFHLKNDKAFKKFIYDEKLFLGANLINGQLTSQLKNDNLTKRNLIRHNPDKLGKFLVENFLN